MSYLLNSDCNTITSNKTAYSASIELFLVWLAFDDVTWHFDGHVWKFQFKYRRPISEMVSYQMLQLVTQFC